MSKELINFKGPAGYKKALLSVACIEGHGNVSRVIVESIDKNPLFVRELKKVLKKDGK